MQKLVDGVRRFQANIFSAKRHLFEKLAEGQDPLCLFITCSDSRINPNLITQTEPGELFILRNAGNIVPAYGASNGGEAGSIEYAVSVLGVEDIIVCGHSHCGAMSALLHPEKTKGLPSIANWLEHAESTRRIVTENYKHLIGELALQTVAVEENVLVQLDNLRTHPSVAAALAREQLNLHAWVYEIETGSVFAFDSQDSQFVPLQQTPLGPRQHPHQLEI